MLGQTSGSSSSSSSSSSISSSSSLGPTFPPHILKKGVKWTIPTKTDNEDLQVYQSLYLEEESPEIKTTTTTTTPELGTMTKTITTKSSSVVKKEFLLCVRRDFDQYHFGIHVEDTKEKQRIDKEDKMEYKATIYYGKDYENSQSMVVPSLWNYSSNSKRVLHTEHIHPRTSFSSTSLASPSSEDVVLDFRIVIRPYRPTPLTFLPLIIVPSNKTKKRKLSEGNTYAFKYVQRGSLRPLQVIGVQKPWSSFARGGAQLPDSMVFGNEEFNPDYSMGPELFAIRHDHVWYHDKGEWTPYQSAILLTERDLLE